MTAAVVFLAAAAAALVAATAAGARPPAGATAGRREFGERWGALHGDFDPRASRWVSGWLRIVAAVATPLARRGVQPDALSWWTVWLGAAAVVAAVAGGRWALLAAVLVVAAAAFDALDGAVAVLAGRSTAWGFVLDSLLDRVNDALFVAALWALGGPGRLAVLAGALGWLHEYARARAAGAGMAGVGAITVGERPTRVLCCAAGLIGAGLAPAWARAAVTAALAVLAVLSGVGLAHLLVVVRRRL